MAEIREAVLLGAYTNTPEREQTLIDVISKWKKHDLPIILGTHYPVSRKIQNLVDYYVFDKNQHLDPSLTLEYFYIYGDFRITTKFDRPYHGPAAVIAEENALKSIGKKYDFIYLQDFDVELDIEETLKLVREIRTPEKELYMFHWYDDPNSYATNVYFFYRSGFTTLWRGIESVDDYKSLINISGSNNFITEALAKNLIVSQRINAHVFDFETGNKLLLNLTKHDATPQKIRIYLSTTTTYQPILFLINEPPVDSSFHIKEINLETKEERDIEIDLLGNSAYWIIFSSNSHIDVKVNDISKSYDVPKGTIFKECKFEFYNNIQVYMLEEV